MDKRQIQKTLRIFVRRVKDTFPSKKIILFGSYAKGVATEYSDIDILVISKAFLKMEEKERFDKLYRLSKDLYPDINAFGFTPEEVKTVSPLTSLYEALKYGKVIS